MGYKHRKSVHAHASILDTPGTIWCWECMGGGGGGWHACLEHSMHGAFNCTLCTWLEEADIETQCSGASECRQHRCVLWVVTACSTCLVRCDIYYKVARALYRCEHNVIVSSLEYSIHRTYIEQVYIPSCILYTLYKCSVSTMQRGISVS